MAEETTKVKEVAGKTIKTVISPPPSEELVDWLEFVVAKTLKQAESIMPEPMERGTAIVMLGESLIFNGMRMRVFEEARKIAEEYRKSKEEEVIKAVMESPIPEGTKAN